MHAKNAFRFGAILTTPLETKINPVFISGHLKWLEGAMTISKSGVVLLVMVLVNVINFLDPPMSIYKWLPSYKTVWIDKWDWEMCIDMLFCYRPTAVRIIESSMLFLVLPFNKTLLNCFIISQLKCVFSLTNSFTWSPKALPFNCRAHHNCNRWCYKLHITSWC